ncbi:hypothetical protein JTB14_027831 [Gonioctena quinquepunctata]|nr:hypothetical protein JTB14_027831 [Gonioctena quinquepunctata]
MDRREEKKLLRWFEESDDDNFALSESESDPFSDDGEFNGDSDYVPDDSPTDSSRNESESESRNVEDDPDLEQNQEENEAFAETLIVMDQNFWVQTVLKLEIVDLENLNLSQKVNLVNFLACVFFKG